MDSEQYSFNSHPRAVKYWLGALPVAHIGETSRKIYTALKSINEQEAIPLKHLIQLMQRLTFALDLVLPVLHKHYAGKPQPLSSKQRKIADLYTQLLHQTILVYQQIINRAVELNRFSWKKQVSNALQQIFHYSGLMLLNHRLLYLPLPKGWWQRLYWMFEMAENSKLLHIKIRTDGSLHKTSIHAQFAKLLLLAQLSPNLFKFDELNEVLETLDYWTSLTNIGPTRLHNEDRTYAFNLDTDIPPCMITRNINITVNTEVEARYLHVAMLFSRLEALQENAQDGAASVQLSRQHHLSRRSLLLLTNAWYRPSGRDGERRLIQGQAELAIGVSAIHYVISQAQPESSAPRREPIIIRSPGARKARKNTNNPPQDYSLASLGFATDRDVQVDIWESVYFEPASMAPGWTESIRMKVYSHLNAKVMNISKGGFCIAIPPDGVDHIQLGELVAIRGKRGEWQLGQIRWLLCPKQAPMRAGIQRLSQSVQPAMLHVQAKGKTPEPINCLLGRNETGKMVFFPNLPFSLTEKNLQLETEGNKRRFKLIDTVYTSPAGSAYYFDWRQQSDALSANPAKSPDRSIWASI